MNNSSHDCFITDRIFAAESGGRGRHFSEILGTSADEDGEDVDVLRRPDDDSYCNVEQKTYHFSQEKSNGSGYIIEAEIILREIENQRNRPLV